ncbi:hypothetical protein [Reticulibacter mediterranei]|uniref:hypothetical protein n=1 Tax=Reticulibacter mediterranei TaxID=2778369 RepID=UPI001C688BD4|nr:hypothetical protein [Reticulibacter mediterranei]
MLKNTHHILSSPPGEALPDRRMYALKMAWRLRWFFAIILAGGYGASVCTGLLGFIFTQNASYLVLASAPLVLLPAIRYLVPMHRFQYWIEVGKIAGKAQAQRGRVERRKQS